MPQNRFKNSLLNIPRQAKQLIVVLADLLMAWLAVVLAVDLRFEASLPVGPIHAWLYVLAVALALPIFMTTGLYRAIFRYAGLQVIFSLNKALALYTAMYLLVFTVVGVPGVPRSLGLAQPMVFAFLVMSSRLFARHWLGGMGLKARSNLVKPVLIYGAGSAGRQLANSIYQSQELVAVGYVDDDDRLHGHSLNGLTIHDPQTLARVVADKQVVEIYLALPSVSRKRRNEIIEALKPLAEMVLQAIAQRSSQTKTRFSMVRFGNVLGSSGSVVPLFRQQIQQGGPITLTDARMTRYFMTIPEAAQLVIQAGAMASGGDVFVLDMGESVKIMDLARRMIELSGLTVQDEVNPEGDIAIEVTGLRPGEKLYEELLIGDNPMPTQHPRIMKAHEEFLPWPELQAQLTELMQAVETNNVPAMRAHIQRLVPGYQPDGEVVDWVWLEQAKVA